MIIPGASELEKLVLSAEAWAAEACKVLKIKVLYRCYQVLHLLLLGQSSY